MHILAPSLSFSVLIYEKRFFIFLLNSIWNSFDSPTDFLVNNANAYSFTFLFNVFKSSLKIGNLLWRDSLIANS